ncbi:MAG TPA: hypothetical protein VFQ38_15160 [Longimicrobiales bacterium]|nr:hypothetical protein [Longimicrobiales bacterium]
MSRAPARRSGVVLLASTLCFVAAGAARAQSGRQWRPEERVLVTRFADAYGLAADLRNLYVATNGGLEVYDFVGRRWAVPVTVEDGFPAAERPTALAYDRFHDDVWMATSTGGIYTYSGAFGQWSRKATSPAAPIHRIVMDPGGSGDLYFAAPGGWLRLRQGSLLLEPVGPGQVPPGLGSPGSGAAALLQADPYLRSALGTLSLDERGRRWPITAIIGADVPATYWVGTDGGNVARFDSRTMQPEWLRFGVPSFGVASVAADDDALWFGADGRGPGRGVTRASADLQSWRTWEPDLDNAPAGAVSRVLPTAAAVWFGAADGLYRLDRERGRFQRIEESDGLPADAVAALAPAADGVWAGTRRGLALVGDDGRVRAPAVLAGHAVAHLALSGDTLWISSDAGLWVIPAASAAGTPTAPARPPAAERDGATADSTARPAPAAATTTTAGPALLPTPLVAPGTENHAALRGRVLAAAPVAGAVWAVTSDALYRFDGANWLVVRDPTLGSIGRPTSLASDDGQLWVAGARGIAHFDPASQIWTSYTVGADLPAGPVWSVLPRGDDVWAATPAGALRLRWR